MRYLFLGAFALLCFSVVGAFKSVPPRETADIGARAGSSFLASRGLPKAGTSLGYSNRPLLSDSYQAPSPVKRQSASMQETAVDKRLARAELVLNIQRALRAVNCAPLRETGVWDGQTQRAMDTLLTAANASLPVNEPEEAFLALIQAKRDMPDFDCVRMARKNLEARTLPVAPVVANTGVAAVEPVTAPGSVTASGRMSLGGPAQAPEAVAAPSPVKASRAERSEEDLFLHPLGRL